jgi:glutathione S-transferase
VAPPAHWTGQDCRGNVGAGSETDGAMTVTLYHAPQTRSSGVLALLEELGTPYALEVLDMKREEQRAPAYLAINPLGKVPSLHDGAAIVTEQVAIFLHLADRFPDAGLAPAIDDPQRGPYLRWMVFYAAAFEPALVDRARGHAPGTRAMSPYGEVDTVIDALAAALAPGPYLLGERFSAADILWGTALRWTMHFKLVPERPVFVDYAQRVGSRPKMASALARDAEMAAAQKQASAP